jgi:uncharacterized membrane protein
MTRVVPVFLFRHRTSLLVVLVALLLAASAVMASTSLDGHQLRTFQRLSLVSGLGLLVVAAAGERIRSRLVQPLVRFEAWLAVRPSRAALVLAALVLAYVVLWCGVSFLRHYYFHSSYDLAIMDQVAWNSSNGRLFARSIEVDNDLGDHVRPYLTGLGLLYALQSSPYVLLGFQSLVLGLSAIPLYRLARRQSGSPAVGLILAFCLLAYPPLGFLNRFDFHIEALSVPLLILAYDRLDAGSLRTASVFMALTLLCKENLGLTVAALGVVAALFHGRRAFGAAWAVIGTAYSLAALLIVIPAFRGAPSDTLSRYEWLGDMPSGMLWAAVSQPALIVQKIFTFDHLLTLLQSFAPLAFVPLAGWPLLLPTVPTYGYNFLASHPAQATIYVHYMAPVIPFVCIAAVAALRRAGGNPRSSPGTAVPLQRKVALLSVLMAAATVASWIYQNPITGNATVVLSTTPTLMPTETAVGSAPRVPLIWPNHNAIREGLQHVPDGVGVLTTTYYAPHLSQRMWIEMIPKAPVSDLDSRAETVFLNLRDPRSWTCEDYLEVLRAAAGSDFGVAFSQDGVIVLQRTAGDRAHLSDLLHSWRGCD